MSTFYVPLVIILLLYWKIFMTARARLRKRIAQKARVPLDIHPSPPSQNNHNTKTPLVPSSSVKKPNPSNQNNGVIPHTNGNGNGNSTTNINSTQNSSPPPPLPPRAAKQATLVTVEADGNGKAETCLATSVAFEETNMNLDHDEDVGADSGEGEANGGQPQINEKDKFINRGCQTESLRLKTGKGSKKALTATASTASELAAAAATAKELKKRHVSLEAKRERKAAKTLAIVTGAFIACWLPFFILALFMAIYHDWHFNPHLVSFFLWLGYFNSTLNPIIYTIFSPEFRTAFKRILCGKSHVQNHRPRHLQ